MTDNQTQTTQETPGLVRECVAAARDAQQKLVGATPRQLAQAVRNMAQAVRMRVDAIAAANEADMKRAARDGLPDALVARLTFAADKAARRADVLDQIASLPSPLGRFDRVDTLWNGLRAGKMRSPIGVIAMIYEARPHVTLNAGALCLRTGNAAILKAGSEVDRTNQVLGGLWNQALEAAELPGTAVQVVTAPGREVLPGLLGAADGIDVIIPRGGKALIRSVSESSSVPVVKHFEGNCHVYVDDGADINKAVAICVDGKTLMPEVCNATESLVVAAPVAESFLPALARSMGERGVEIRACERALPNMPGATPATDDDFRTEYLDMILSVKVVGNLDEAIRHINLYGSHHTDAIVSPWQDHIRCFVDQVDSAVVLANASTMFCDGNTLGMGAEIGISTDKLHARGPMGMEELTTYKWVIQGDGHVMGGNEG